MGTTRTVNLGEKLADVMKEIGMTKDLCGISGSRAGLADMIHNMKHGGKIALWDFREERMLR